MPAAIALFRKLALSLPDAIESSHFNQPDFRINNHIFATLAAQARGCGMVKLTPEQQAAFIAELPGIFEPVPGAWGLGGATLVHLDAVDEATLLGALTTAYHNVVARKSSSKAKRTPQ
ncbi:MmcQ/YjbR family DNA-binding protein [Granulicella arctica]|uniref:MmcQ/YjbR family DNA-binding protein n=1 Tax=Granulicella arctica TaxID=940613 RepID=UPI0021E05026|nr:MmcQ/YjbR family DNA-binding protein [Granulicella arctica]